MSPERGEAGRSGDDVRSDVHVVLEPATGRQIVVTSKVEALYGDAIRSTVAGALDALGIGDVRVTVDDRGALDWVIAARVAAAARAAGMVDGGSSGEAGGPATRRLTPAVARTVEFAATSRDRLRRSRLYLPGNEPKFMLNAGLHAPDGVILDLEDSVHPDAKAEARVLVACALRSVDFGPAERMVRINQLPLGLDDLEAVVPESPNLVLIPKVERPDQVTEVSDAIRRIQAEHGIDPGDRPVWLMPILESALGLEHAYAIAAADERVVALTIGLEDYTADLGVVKTADGEESLWARRRLVNAAHAAKVQAIDSVYGDVADEEGLRAWGRRARAMGFTGMGCVHPRQIRVIHEAFAPGPEELEKAQRIVVAFREAEAKGLGVVSLGSKMIDPPVVLRARRLVEHARRMGLIEEGEDAAAGGASKTDGPEGGEA
ncbi:MAG: aldolase/citrate lyase family protein [Candidatus Longimicrobiales bacterium M2_2A_002]